MQSNTNLNPPKSNSDSIGISFWSFISRYRWRFLGLLLGLAFVFSSLFFWFYKTNQEYSNYLSQCQERQLKLNTFKPGIADKYCQLSKPAFGKFAILKEYQKDLDSLEILQRQAYQDLPDLSLRIDTEVGLYKGILVCFQQVSPDFLPTFQESQNKISQNSQLDELDIYLQKKAQAQTLAQEVSNLENRLQALDLDWRHLSKVLDLAEEIPDQPKINDYSEVLQYCLDYQEFYARQIEQEGEKKVLEVLQYQYFTGRDFQLLYDQKVQDQYQNVNYSQAKFAISDNNLIDTKILDLATGRGYKLRPIAEISNLVQVGLEDLQPQAKDAWLSLQSYAKSQGVNLGLLSGFRSPEDQAKIFLNRVNEIGFATYSEDQILSGEADSLLDRVLQTSSIPGYSKHHTGYTIDIRDLDSSEPFTKFSQTPAYAWLSEDNYLIAKKFGFIPSYPQGQEKAGPEPEAWEYVWVPEKFLVR